MVAFGHCVSYKTGKDWSKKTVQHQHKSYNTRKTEQSKGQTRTLSGEKSLHRKALNHEKGSVHWGLCWVGRRRLLEMSGERQRNGMAGVVYDKTMLYRGARVGPLQMATPLDRGVASVALVSNMHIFSYTSV